MEAQRGGEKQEAQNNELELEKKDSKQAKQAAVAIIDACTSEWGWEQNTCHKCIVNNPRPLVREKKETEQLVRGRLWDRLS